ncbi:hypothetical protein KEJ28_04045 [Candidatus Bathyarchaeota archaeon]|nr:hypothetical protein [Candidatus Bathyarchaeota archaeon]
MRAKYAYLLEDAETSANGEGSAAMRRPQQTITYIQEYLEERVKQGEAFLILAFSTDTCVTAIVLALLVIVVKKYGTCDIRKLAEIEQSADEELTKFETEQ